MKNIGDGERFHGGQCTKKFRPIPDSPECSNDNDIVTVAFVGESYMYVIPCFDVIAV